MSTRLEIGCAVLLVAAALASHAQQIVVSKENRTIAVTTERRAQRRADTVTVQIGFIAYGTDQDSAYALGSKTSNAIAAALKAAGIPPDAIQSESQSIAPVQQYGNQDWTPDEKVERKFQVTQSWSVKTAAGNGAKVLDVAIKAGANQSGQMSWSVADQDGLQAKAAKLALERARQIAQQMAGGLNATLGPWCTPAMKLPHGSLSHSECRRSMAAAPTAQRSRAPERQRAQGHGFGDGLCCVQYSIEGIVAGRKDAPMARYDYRELKPTPEAEDLYRRWMCHLDEEFTRHKESRLRGEIVRDALAPDLPGPSARRQAQYLADLRIARERLATHLSIRPT